MPTPTPGPARTPRSPRRTTAALPALLLAALATLGACRDGASDGEDTAATTVVAPTSTTQAINPDLPRTATGSNGNPRDARIGPPADNRPSDGTLQAGTCFDEFIEAQGDALLHRLQVKDCAAPHDGEVFAVVTIETAANAPFPGEAEATKLADGLCLARFEAFVGREYATSVLRTAVLRPTATTWAAGDRNVVCSLYDEDLTPLVGTARSSAR